MIAAMRKLLALGLYVFAGVASAQGVLENPVAASTESGIGLVSGWHCTAKEIRVFIDGVDLGKSGVGSIRNDTAGICGHVNTGFSLLYNYNKLAPGLHTIMAYADGVLLETRQFNSAQSGGVPFLEGMARDVIVPGFPQSSATTMLRWSQAKQSFVAIGATPPAPAPVSDTATTPQGVLENPVAGSTESGIGLVSGWHCTAKEIRVFIDGVDLGKSGVGSIRNDTAGICGHVNTGFSLLYNYNKLTPGLHTITAYADGVLLGTRQFNSAQSGGVPFLEGMARDVIVPDFPLASVATTLRWSQAKQSFVAIGATTPAPAASLNLAGTAIVSRIDVPAVTPIYSASVTKPLWDTHYLASARLWGWGDFNADGLNDVVICPAYRTALPVLSCEIWLNRDGGRFESATSEVFEGAVGPSPNPNSVFVRDFNRDGRPDILVVSQGLEDPDLSTPYALKARNRLFMSQPNGKLKDVTNTALASDTLGFHHPSAVGDVNGDGWLDVIVCELGGFAGSGLATGIYFLINDKKGGFTRTTAGLPQDLASIDMTGPNPPNIDHFSPGTVQGADLDGDGRLDLIVTTYHGGTQISNKFETRIYRQAANGNFSLAATIPYPAEVAAVRGWDGTRPGASGIAAGDLNGDGRPDIVILMENVFIEESHVVVLRNNGGFSFSDVTKTWLGGYEQAIKHGGRVNRIAGLQMADLDGNGTLDLVYMAGGFFHNALATTSPFLLNDGTGKLTPWLPTFGGERFTGQTLADPQWQNLLKIPYTNNTELWAFDATGDGLIDWVFMDGLNLPSEPPAMVVVDGVITERAVNVRVVPQIAQ